MAVTGVIVLVHGSRGKRGKVEIEIALERIVAQLKPYLVPNVEIVGAALQFNQPTLEEAVALLSSRQIDRVIIVPYFLFTGRHLTEHVPQAIGDLQLTYPETQFMLADNLGMDEHFVGLLAKRVRQAAPDISVREVSSRGRTIESESMRIIDNLFIFPSEMLKDEAAVVKRIIHASGDIEIGYSIRFSPSAVSSGIQAIAQGKPIVTDVRMLMAGIDSHLADAFGCHVSCALDILGTPNLPEGTTFTRSAAAMQYLGSKLNGSIVAIGNAPTALFALLDMINDARIKPALVVGMPVGFVKADESKQELMKCEIPYVTVTGTRGGSAMAAATVNALLRLAWDRSQLDSTYKGELEPDATK